MSFNYERGLEKLKSLIGREEWFPQFNTLALRLADNIAEERSYGRADLKERYKIIEELDRLTIQYGLEKTFSELSSEPPRHPLGGAPPMPIRQPPEREVPLDEASQVQPSASEQRVLSYTQQPNLVGTGHHWAVLVGVSKYEDIYYYGQLEYCASDARKIYQQLLLGGFEENCIHLICDGEKRLPTKENILASLQAIAGAAELDDLLLFYFSGHGEYRDGNMYLVPYNTRGIVQSDSGVPIARVKEIMEGANVRAKIILLDACHSGEKLRSKASKAMSDEFFKTVVAPAEGMVIFASCSSQQYSYEWTEEQCGAFTYYLLEALRGIGDEQKKGYVTIADVNRHVSFYVRSWASQRQLVQTPTLNYQVSGEILLVYYTEADLEREVADADTPPSLPVIENDSLAPHLVSIHNYIGTLSPLLKKTRGLVNSPRKVYEFRYNQIVRDIGGIEKPSILQPGVLPQEQEQRMYGLIVELNFIDHTCTNMVADINELMDVQRKARQSVKKLVQSAGNEQKKSILKALSTLQRRIESVSDTVSALEVKKPPGQQEGGGAGTTTLNQDRLAPYVGDISALRQGRVHQELGKEAVKLGVNLGAGSELPAEDPLARARRVPLHAIILYTGEDAQVGEYINRHANDLSTISDDLCDIYLSLGQLKDRESAYDHIKKLTVIKQSDMPEYKEVPGILFWDHQGRSAYVPFGKSATHDEIKHVLRTIFGVLQRQAAIASVQQAKQVLEREQHMSSIKESGQQNGRGSGWSDILKIALAFVIIIAGLIFLAQFVNPILFSIALIAALLFFVLFMVWYLRSRSDLSESNLVKIVGRFFNALPLLREGSQREEQPAQRKDNT